MLFFKRKAALVCGISMEPVLKSGDLVFYEPISNKSCLSKGDIIIFNHPIRKINLIKRISEIKVSGIEVSGDNINFSDDSNYFGLINKETIIGVVTSHISRKSIQNFKKIFKLKK
tara:strand:- start:512 stop:856 length:345 start_codon:yes stop_codon:yes gene_type:complete